MEGAIVVLLTIISMTAAQYPGVILQHPETQSTLPGGSETFVCTAQGDVIWYINNKWVSISYKQALTGLGFVFTDHDLSGYPHPTANLTVTIPARNDLNGTEVHCRSAGTNGNIVISHKAWLWIISPPLTPNVSVELTSWNTMRLSWTAPFTSDGYPIIKYVILTTNSSTGQRSRTDVYPTDGNESLSIVDTPSDCHSLQFEIIAQNSAGNSSSHNISAGFPIAVKELNVISSLIYIINQEEVNAIVSFQLPEVCSGDSGIPATYILELRTVSGVLVHRTESQYHESSTIEETLTVDIWTSYSINVSVFIPSFPELGTYSNISIYNVSLEILKTTEDSSDSTTPLSSKSSFTPETTGQSSKNNQSAVPQLGLLISVIVILLLMVLIIGGLIIVCVQQRRRKTVNMSTTNAGYRMSLPTMENNPIYDDQHVHPVYDVIPEAQAKCFEAKPPPPPLLRKQVSCDLRYSHAPKSLPLETNGRQRSVSVCQSPFTPETPSPRDVDALLRNTSSTSFTPLNKGHKNERRIGGVGEGGGGGGREEVYDSLCKKLPPWKEREGEDNDAERDDSYVMMQSNIVYGH